MQFQQSRGYNLMTDMPSWPVFKLIRAFIPNILICSRVLTIILKIEVKKLSSRKSWSLLFSFQKIWSQR